MSPLAESVARRSPWPHRWAVLLTCATFPLLWWGGFVTATGSGMAFKDWLTSDGVFMPLYPWLSSAGDKFIEHGHRLLGMLTGLLAMALVAALYWSEPRRWVRWFGLALLLGVVLQGVLGGVRVKLDEYSPNDARLVALVHGCTGPVFFAATAAMAMITSRRWTEDSPMPLGRPAAAEAVHQTTGRRAKIAPRPSADALVRLAGATASLAYLQLVVGAVVRHSPLLQSAGAATVFRIAVYFHVMLAIVVTVYVLRLAHRCFWHAGAPGVALSLLGLILVQLLLGVTTWVVKYGMPAWTVHWIGETGHYNRAVDVSSAGVAAAHGAVGSLIVAACVAATLALSRRAGRASRPVAGPVSPTARVFA